MDQILSQTVGTKKLSRSKFGSSFGPKTGSTVGDGLRSYIS